MASDPPTINQPASKLAVLHRWRCSLTSRREILKLILTTPSSRREQVAALLDVEEIDKQRKELAGAVKDAEATVTRTKVKADAKERELLEMFQPPAPNLEDVLVKVNASRLNLGATPVDALSGARVRTSISAPVVVSDANPIRVVATRLKRIAAADSSASTVCDSIQCYLGEVGTARGTDADVADHQRRLFEAGLVLGTKDHCPLCERPVAIASLLARNDPGVLTRNDPPRA